MTLRGGRCFCGLCRLGGHLLWCFAFLVARMIATCRIVLVSPLRAPGRTPHDYSATRARFSRDSSSFPKQPGSPVNLAFCCQTRLFPVIPDTQGWHVSHPATARIAPHRAPYIRRAAREEVDRDRSPLDKTTHPRPLLRQSTQEPLTKDTTQRVRQGSHLYRLSFVCLCVSYHQDPTPHYTGLPT